MLRRIQTSIKKHQLLSPGQHVLVAVSGGADSVALLYALQELAPSLGISLTAVHLNHCIRGKASDDDAAFVMNLTASLNIPFVQGRSDVPRRARRKGLSLEMAAREARYTFLGRMARKVGADIVATAHTADDQVETILLKLTRGAGPRGLSGIPREITLCGLRVVRPMLDVTRNEIIAFLGENGLSWREDESNRDVSFLRNRVRHEVLPVLESKLNPKIRDVLLRTAEVISEEDRWLENLAGAILVESCIKNSGLSVSGGHARHTKSGHSIVGLECPESFQSLPDKPVLNIEALGKYPLAARRRVLRLWLACSGVSAELIDFDTVGRIENLLQRKKGSGEVNIAGNWTVRRQYKQLSMEASLHRVSPPPFRVAVKIPGETILPEPRLRVATSLEPGVFKAKAVGPGALPSRASISYQAVGRKKVFVRSWRAGDRMNPLGLNGSKKLQDIFVDQKVPANQRKRIPLFECCDEIIWLPGYRVAQGWQVGDPAVPSLQIQIERI